MRSEQGSFTVEFAIVGLLFFILVFAVIETGRLIYTWHGLAEATRRGARIAAVCPVNDSAPAQVALFSTPGESSESPILPGLSTSNISLSYLDEAGSALASPSSDFGKIRYVRVAIANYQHRFLVPVFATTMTAPRFETVLPRESLGVLRDEGSVHCFGKES